MRKFKARLRQTWRKRWLTVHLYLGIGAGIILGIAGVTGSILTFYLEIDDWLNRHRQWVEIDARGVSAYRPVGDMIAAADRAARPDEHRNGFRYPRTEGIAAYVSYVRRDSTTQEDVAYTTIYVNPWTAQVTGTKSYPAGAGLPEDFIDFIAVLHYRLLLGWGTGDVIVGIAAMGSFTSVLTGIYLWWPRKGQWKKALIIKRNTSSQRRNYDIHKWAGLITMPVMLAVLLSGIYFNFHAPFTTLVKAFSPTTEHYKERLFSTPRLSATTIGTEKALAIADATYPQGQLKYIVEPDGPEGVYEIIRINVPELSHFWSERHIWVEQYSGEIIHVADPLNRDTAGETFLAWQWPLHSGQALGLAGRILVMLCGLACPVLFYSGLRHWRNKTAKHNQARRST
jgi:uncharacterized iron-regulated membrane protein